MTGSGTCRCSWRPTRRRRPLRARRDAALCTDNSTVLPANCTEVKMVPFNNSQHAITPFPDWWYTPGLNFTFDDRTGGVPDPTTRGPAMIQIGTEGRDPAGAGGDPQPAGQLHLQPQGHRGAERPGACIASRTGRTGGRHRRLHQLRREDAHPLQRRARADTGRRPAPRLLHGQPGGPNRHRRRTDDTARDGSQHPDDHADRRERNFDAGRSRVDDDYVDRICAALSAPAPAPGLPAAFAASQDPIIVPQSAYNPAYGTSVVDVPGSNLSRISDTSLDVHPAGRSVR